MTATDDVVEQEADEHPRHKVQRRRRRQGARTAEDNGEIEVLEETNSKLLVQSPLEERGDGTGQEEEDKAVVELTIREEPLRSNDTPLGYNISKRNRMPTNTAIYNDRRGTEYGGRRTDEAVFLSRGAYVFDVGKHP